MSVRGLRQFKLWVLLGQTLNPANPKPISWQKKMINYGDVVKAILGESWVVISGVRSPLIWVIKRGTLLITPFITTHEPPSIIADCVRCYSLDTRSFQAWDMGKQEVEPSGIRHEWISAGSVGPACLRAQKPYPKP